MVESGWNSYAPREPKHCANESVESDSLHEGLQSCLLPGLFALDLFCGIDSDGFRESGVTDEVSVTSPSVETLHRLPCCFGTTELDDIG